MLPALAFDAKQPSLAVYLASCQQLPHNLSPEDGAMDVESVDLFLNQSIAASTSKQVTGIKKRASTDTLQTRVDQYQMYMHVYEYL
jgi:hypothetical protein